MVKYYRKNIIGFYVIAVVAMGFAAFFDLKIDIWLNNPENPFCVWFYNTGEMPCRLALPIAGAVIVYTSGKMWQKTAGIVSLAILAIINFVIYGLSDMQTIYKGHPSIERVLSDSHDALLNIGYLVLANYLIIVFLFICLWRKGGKQ